MCSHTLYNKSSISSSLNYLHVYVYSKKLTVVVLSSSVSSVTLAILTDVADIDLSNERFLALLLLRDVLATEPFISLTGPVEYIICQELSMCACNHVCVCVCVCLPCGLQRSSSSSDLCLSRVLPINSEPSSSKLGYTAKQQTKLTMHCMNTRFFLHSKTQEREIEVYS